MSFIRVLLALLISGGIAYGLYHVVEEQKMERASQTEAVAERAEIADAGDADNTGDAAPSDDPALDAEEPDAEPESGDTTVTEQAQQPEEAVEQPVTAETTEPSDSDASNADDSAASTLAALPETSEAPESDEDQPEAPDVTAVLPAAAIQNETSDSIAALDIVTGGMAYAEARETLIGAGWTPRAVDERSGSLDGTETVLIDAGYNELEGCSGAERAICRFEFVDGQKRIAAVLTAGSDGDPSVIDAFLMNIAKPE